MTRLRVFAILLLLVVAACGGESSSPEPSAQSDQPEEAGLEGAYRFSQVNGQFPPVEFPVGSGDLIETGTLEFDPAGRFSLQFIVGGPLGSAPSGEAGAYRVSADSLYFTPDGSAGPPEVFRFEVGEEQLLLRDSEGNLWLYLRRQ